MKTESGIITEGYDDKMYVFSVGNLYRLNGIPNCLYLGYKIHKIQFHLMEREVLSCIFLVNGKIKRFVPYLIQGFIEDYF